MSEHELLIRHASNWAQQRHKVCDTDLLEAALELRLQHDDLPPNLWPAGSVEDLMLHRWPAHGHDTPDVDALADSLDTFVRFLRATGRMASGSGDPKALAREAHRSAPKMAAACADTRNHGPAKSLLSFGREAGFSLDDMDSIEELQAALSQVTEAWNALPEEERRARMPLPGDSAAGFDLGPLANGLEPAVDDDAFAGVGTGFIERGDPVRAAAQAREAPFVQACLRLADWVGDRKEVTATGVLRVAEARRAYADLELWRWQEEVDVLDLSRSGTLSRKFMWKRSGDALPLERLWFASQGAGLVETLTTVARSSGERPQDDDEWVGLSAALTLSLWLIVESSFDMSPVPVLVLLGGCALMGSITGREVRQQWDEHPTNLWRSEVMRGQLEPEGKRFSDRQLDLSLHFFADTGIWELDGDTYRLTDLGSEFATALFTYLDERGS